MSVPFDMNIQPLDGSDPYDVDVPENALAISARINRMIQLDRFQRQQFEREWFRNVLFYVGQHWRRTHRFRPR
jgi:hypothetical protein